VSLPAEDSCPRPRTRGDSGPLLGEMLVPRAPGGFGWHGGFGDPRLSASGAAFSGTCGATGPSPEQRAGPGPLARQGGLRTARVQLSCFQRVVYNNYASPCPDAVGGGTPVPGYRQRLQEGPRKLDAGVVIYDPTSVETDLLNESFKS